MAGSESRIREIRIPFEGFPENFAPGIEPQAVEESDDQVSIMSSPYVIINESMLLN